MKLPFAKTATALILTSLLILLPVRFSPVVAQTASTVGFTMNPSVFQQGQDATTLICMSPLPDAGILTFNQNDVIGFQFDNSIGSVESVFTPLMVHSSTLDPGDFQPHVNSVNHNKLSITYANEMSKQFAYTDTVCIKVLFSASITAGSGVVRYSSKFTGIAGVAGDLPYLTATVVDFPTGTPGPQGIQGPKGDQGDPGPQGPPGTSPDLTSVLSRLGGVERAELEGRIYVANSNDDNVSVIDALSNIVVAKIPVGDQPGPVAINPAKTRVYVANQNSNDVSVIDTATNSVIATIPLGASFPNEMAINLAGTRLYVTNDNSAKVSVIDITNNTLVKTVAVGNRPTGIAINAAGTLVYVANKADATISVIAADSNNLVIDTIQTRLQPNGLAINAPGTRLWVAQMGGFVSEINPITKTEVRAIDVGTAPYGLALSPNSSFVYVTNLQFSRLTIIDTSTNAITTNLTVNANPFHLAVNSPGSRVYVANNGIDTISVINTITNTVVATVGVGSGPMGVAVK